MISYFGWTGNLLFVLGAIFLAKKNRYGFHCQILANLCYIIFSLLMEKDGLSLCALSVLLIAINYYGLKKWENKQWILIKS